MIETSRRPVIIGHRGARGLFPENTLSGFRRAFAAGVAAVELDVAVTADDVVVVTHDPHLNPDITRGPDGSWLVPPTPLIRSLTFAQLQAYDVGSIRPETRYAAAFREQRPEDGARIPALADVLELARKPSPTNEQGEIRFLIELKTFPDRPELTVSPARMADLVVAVAQAGAINQVTGLSFDWRGLRHLQSSRPGLPLGWLTEPADDAQRALWWDIPGAAPLPSAPGAVAASGGRLWLPYLGELTQTLVAEARSLGLEIITWGVSDRADAERARGLAVDGIISDRPDLA